MPPERNAPWWMIGVLVVAALIEIVVSGYNPSDALDLVSMATVFAIPLVFLACLLWQLAGWRTRRIVVAAELTTAVGARVSPAEADEYIHAVEAIQTHFLPRDVRDVPPEGHIAIASMPASRIRVWWKHPGFAASLEPFDP